MTPEQSEILSKLEAIQEDQRSARTAQSARDATLEFLVTGMKQVMLRVESQEGRIVALESGAVGRLPPMREPSVSFTTEVAKAVGPSIAPSLKQAMAPNWKSTLAAAVLLAIAILAHAVFGH